MKNSVITVGPYLYNNCTKDVYVVVCVFAKLFFFQVFQMFQMFIWTKKLEKKSRNRAEGKKNKEVRKTFSISNIIIIIIMHIQIDK